jgi:hypothetical protein
VTEARLTFETYIATAGPGRAANAARALVGATATAAARERWSGKLHGPTVTRNDVELALGEADVVDESSLGYLFAAVPDHVYTFKFDDGGRQIRAGFERRGAEPRRVADPPADQAEYPAYLRGLAAAEITEAELVQALGAPIERNGWWPCETLRFGNGLELELRHGLVLAD